MRALWLLLIVPLAGCINDDVAPVASDDDEAPCPWAGMQTLYLGPDHKLYAQPQAEGRTPGNGFAEAFLTNDLDEWTFGPFDAPVQISGNVTLTFWSEGNAMPAPIVIGGDPGEGYHFFNQFGTSRGFVESYAIEYEAAVGDTALKQFDEVFVMPPGGLTIERGDTVRLLLTNLVLDDAEGHGPDILWGGTTPSALRLDMDCAPERSYGLVQEDRTPVRIPFHHGLLTGAVPATEGVNFQDVAFTLHNTTDRLTIELEQTSTTNPVKDDIDLSVQVAGGEAWSIGSPYSDEIGTLWRANLDAMMPPGGYTVRVNSYSGHAYEGALTVTQETLL